eukprot:13372131-Heterocapsa_arctica.AAC.1
MRLSTSRSDKDYTILHDIDRVTKTNIIQSIVGLGHVYRQQRHQELTDLPCIVNFLEVELRIFDLSTIHKRRGEHSHFWNHVTYLDNETMEAEVSTSMTKRMITEQMREEVLETEGMTMEEQDDDVR